MGKFERSDFFNFEGLGERARRRVPEPYCLINRAGRQQAAVGREGH
jgi:hypothetical protein